MEKQIKKDEELIIKESESLHEAEVLDERKRRLLLVIKTRWAIIASYFVYALIAGVFLISNLPDNYDINNFALIAAGLILLVFYNGILHYYYQNLSRYKILSQIQMILDVFVTTIIIYFTGGTASWFWSVYLLIILQSAFLFDRKIDTMEIAAVAGLSFSLLTILGYSGTIGSYNLSLVENQARNITYNTLKVFWVVASSVTVAIIASYLMDIFRQRERYLDYRSITDGLTGLYNHSYFHKRLQSEIERADRYERTLSVILIDVDDLKKHNDSLGHQAGDKLLRDVSNIFKDSVRSNDVDTIYRYGGDEFAIIAPETSSQSDNREISGAVALAKRIRAKIEDQLPISVSVGISSFPHHGKQSAQIFRAADMSLYEAKEQGKNRVVVATKALIMDKFKLIK